MPSLETPNLSGIPNLSETPNLSELPNLGETLNLGSSGLASDLSEARFLQEQTIASEAIAANQFWWSWKVFGSTFITIFLAELGDKTQVATLLMSAEFHAPWTVFAGAAIALITTSLLGVLVGQWLSKRLSPRTLDTAAGITLALISIGLFWDVLGMS